MQVFQVLYSFCTAQYQMTYVLVPVHGRGGWGPLLSQIIVTVWIFQIGKTPAGIAANNKVIGLLWWVHCFVHRLYMLKHALGVCLKQMLTVFFKRFQAGCVIFPWGRLLALHGAVCVWGLWLRPVRQRKCVYVRKDRGERALWGCVFG